MLLLGTSSKRAAAAAGGGAAGGAAIALPSERGLFVHIPLIIVSGIIALRDKSVSLVWLTLLVVVAEFMIVVARFIYGYEQTFMGDLVRYWYAGLFLFASAYTLYEDGHVRVDILYQGLKEKTKSLPGKRKIFLSLSTPHFFINFSSSFSLIFFLLK